VKHQVEQRIRRAMQLERTRAFARRGNAGDIAALVDGRMPDDAQFMAEFAREEAAKIRNAWRMQKRRQQ
jgi:hypothetical protein